MIKTVIKNIGDGFHIYTGQDFISCELVGEVVKFDDKFVYVKQDESGWVVPVDEKGYLHAKVLFSGILKN